MWTEHISRINTGDLVEKLRAGVQCSARMLPSSGLSLLAWNLVRALSRPALLIADSAPSAEALYRNLVTLAPAPGASVRYYPPRESPGESSGRSNPDILGDRINTLMALQEGQASEIIVAPVNALMVPCLSPSGLNRRTIKMALADEFDLHALVDRLGKLGYALEPEVLLKGQAAVRGGLLDLWPVTEPWPVRLEFFGPVLDSIRVFDPETQASIEKREGVVITPATDDPDPAAKRADNLVRHLASETLLGWINDKAIEEHAAVFEETLLEAGLKDRLITLTQLRQRCLRGLQGGALWIGDRPRRNSFRAELDIEAHEDLPSIERGALHPDILEGARKTFVDEVLGRIQRGEESTYFFFNTQGGLDRFREQYLSSWEKDDAPTPAGSHRGDPAVPSKEGNSPLGRGQPCRRQGRGGLSLHVGTLSEGFRSASAQLRVVAENDLYGRRKSTRSRYDPLAKRAGARKISGSRLTGWKDIQPGDLVVHDQHGIGKYMGLFEIEFSGQSREVLTIEYAGKARLHVPVSQSHLLSRYIGVGKHRPKLHALGGKGWGRERREAEIAVRDLAAHLLETQAARQTLKGYAFPQDSVWQDEFEKAFPYDETEDQERAIREVKEDMETTQPMDRLVCGDVGYGKTEVAMRAAFKAVDNGKQVALLVPTTVLAQQHYTTFTERMAAFPFAIDMLSRFRTRGQQAEIVRKLEQGTVDIVIGTHRLVQSDVKFKELGLVIIDEEQRFGVTHKEHLKHLRQLVDVLTLTATPIPRTLYLSLTGARDMSTIQTAPQERLPIETIVTENTDDVVRRAILRELNRGGQVFFLHNRVKTIERVRQRLERLVPEAKCEVAHGQMNERVLEKVMGQFVAGAFDVLLCTTIIESGVDIPNVNTILIDRADRFGMSDLYQLRGRVGRYKHKAFAYLLLPRHMQLFEVARKRIRAIQKYSSLGAGFKLALRDLEIRGAGNILGAEQSGHIAAVGFDLYCQFLKRTIAQMQGEKPPPIVNVEIRLDFIDYTAHPDEADRAAVIPYDYIEDENLRLRIYRNMAAAVLGKELDALEEELRDRFGPVPEPLQRLLLTARIRIAGAAKEISKVETQGDKVMMTHRAGFLMNGGKFPRMKGVSATERLESVLEIVRTVIP